MTPRRHLRLGTISEGTLKSQDLLAALHAASRHLALAPEDRRTLEALWDDPKTDEAFIEALYILEDYVPDACYLGMHDGDGACLGVWRVQ